MTSRAERPREVELTLRCAAAEASSNREAAAAEASSNREAALQVQVSELQRCSIFKRARGVAAVYDLHGAPP